MRYQHVLTYDPEEQERFLYDNKAEKQGMDIACDIINKEINELLYGKVIESMDEVEQLMMMFYQKKIDNG